MPCTSLHPSLAKLLEVVCALRPSVSENVLHMRRLDKKKTTELFQLCRPGIYSRSAPSEPLASFKVGWPGSHLAQRSQLERRWEEGAGPSLKIFGKPQIRVASGTSVTRRDQSS